MASMATPKLIIIGLLFSRRSGKSLFMMPGIPSICLFCHALVCWLIRRHHRQPPSQPASQPFSTKRTKDEGCRMQDTHPFIPACRSRCSDFQRLVCCIIYHVKCARHNRSSKILAKDLQDEPIKTRVRDQDHPGPWAKATPQSCVFPAGAFGTAPAALPLHSVRLSASLSVRLEWSKPDPGPWL